MTEFARGSSYSITMTLPSRRSCCAHIIVQLTTTILAVHTPCFDLSLSSHKVQVLVSHRQSLELASTDQPINRANSSSTVNASMPKIPSKLAGKGRKGQSGMPTSNYAIAPTPATRAAASLQSDNRLAGNSTHRGSDAYSDVHHKRGLSTVGAMSRPMGNYSVESQGNGQITDHHRGRNQNQWAHHARIGSSGSHGGSSGSNNSGTTPTTFPHAEAGPHGKGEVYNHGRQQPFRRNPNNRAHVRHDPYARPNHTTIVPIVQGM